MIRIYQELRYRKVLWLSILLFYTSLVADMFINPSKNDSLCLFGYIIAILLAALWSILNYIDHLRINPLYKEYTTITEFIKALSLPKEEKLEIQQMMVDYVTDQVSQNVDELTATKTIIQQFKTSELENEQHFFYFHTNHYLLKLATGMTISAVLLYLVKDYVLPTDTLLLTGLTGTLFCYGIGLYLAYLMYQLLNKILLEIAENPNV